MSASIISSPLPVVPVGNSLTWALQLSDIGTPPISFRVLAYQLVDESNNPLTALETIMPRAAATPESIPFHHNLRKLVWTSVPDVFNGTGVIHDETAYKKVKLKYGDIFFDYSDGCTITETIESFSDEITIVNYAVPEWKRPTLGDAFIMSSRPYRNEYTKYSHDFLYIYGATVVEIHAYDKDGNDTLVQTHNTVADRVNMCTIGRAHHAMPSSMHTYRVRVTGSGINQIYFFYPKCDATQHYIEVLFLEQLGGRSTIIFDRSRTIDANSSQTQIVQYVPPFGAWEAENGVDLNILGKSGNTIADKVTTRQITLQKVIEDDTNLIEYYTMFAASKSYHIKYHDDVILGYQKFIVNPGSFRIFQDNQDSILEISGVVHLAENYPNGIDA